MELAPSLPKNPPRGWPRLEDPHDWQNLTRTHKSCNVRVGNRVTHDGLVAYRDVAGHWPYCAWPHVA